MKTTRFIIFIFVVCTLISSCGHFAFSLILKSSEKQQQQSLLCLSDANDDTSQQCLFGIPSIYSHQRRSFLDSASASLLFSAINAPISRAEEDDGTASYSSSSSSSSQSGRPATFKEIPTQFIAALGDPKSSSGENANEWGLWTVDPGPRGASLSTAKELERTGVGSYGWKFDKRDWWLEEHGLIMEAPDFLLPAGRYVVTGGRSDDFTAVLTIDEDGGWKLDNNAKLYDVTHLPCRAARYVGGACSAARANTWDFPVRPGTPMPNVLGCKKQDYAVLFVIGKEV